MFFTASSSCPRLDFLARPPEFSSMLHPCLLETCCQYDVHCWVMSPLAGAVYACPTSLSRSSRSLALPLLWAQVLPRLLGSAGKAAQDLPSQCLGLELAVMQLMCKGLSRAMGYSGKTAILAVHRWVRLWLWATAGPDGLGQRSLGCCTPNCSEVRMRGSHMSWDGAGYPCGEECYPSPNLSPVPAPFAPHLQVQLGSAFPAVSVGCGAGCLKQDSWVPVVTSLSSLV